MTQTLAPPAAKQQVATQSLMPSSAGDCVVLSDATWDDYERLLEIVGDRPGYRITFDDGVLEVEMPSKSHDLVARVIGSIITEYAFSRNIPVVATGSATVRKELKRGGAEPDESYCISSFEAMADIDLAEADPATFPVPDLAVEIDLRPPSVHKTSVYARLGVAEIWRYAGSGPVRVYRRGESGTYGEVGESVELPGFPLARLAEILAMPTRERTEAIAAFRRTGT